MPASDRAVRAGTSSARRWRCGCSAEPPIDIHAGGIDLIFPHHENEIAQSECATGQQFARFWVHFEHLLVENQKMSKSLGNIFTVSDVIERGHRASTLRYLLLSAHHRTRLNFTWAGMGQAEEALRRLTDFLGRLEVVGKAAGRPANPELAARVAQGREEFDAAMRDDLNTAAALGAMFELVRAMNAAIDEGRLGAADVAGGAGRLHALRRRHRRGVAAGPRGRAIGAVGSRDRAAHGRAPGGPPAPRLRRGRSRA